MTKQELEAVWVPRIGPKATAALRRYRWACGIVPITAIVLGVAATYAFEGDTLVMMLGVALMAGAVVAFVIFFRFQFKLIAALSEWYGVKLRGIPKMNPKRFDSWCEARGLHHPGEQVASGQMVTAPDAASGHSR
jgi:RHS repeat-associated protein